MTVDTLKTRLIIVAGMPGAGKSFYCTKLEKEGWKVFDDFYSHAKDDKREVKNSRYYRDFCRAISGGSDTAISDIVFCVKEEQKKILDFINEKWGDEVMVEWHIFKNNPRKCWANAERRRRAKEHKDREKVNISKLTKMYNIPKGAIMMDVYRKK